jgi:O-antigen/teichoic acid export membrane protein
MTSASRAQRAAADISVQLVARVANILLGVVVVVLLTRELGVRGFGEWSTVLAVCTVAGYIGELGLEPAAVRRAAARPDEQADVVGTLLLLRVLLALPAAVASFVAVLLVATSPAMVTAGLLVASMSLVSAASALRVVFQLRVRNDVPMIVMTVNSLLWMGAVVALASTGSSSLVAFAAGLLVANVVSTALLAALALRSERVRFGGFRTHSRELLRVGVVLGMGQFLTFAYERIDLALLLHFTDEFQAGLYGAVYQLLDRAQFIPMAVLTTLLPLLTLARATDPERLRRLVLKAFELLMLASLPVVAFSLAAAEPFVALLFGEEYRPAAPALPVLMGAFVLTALGYLLFNLALVVDAQARILVITAAALTVNVVANVLLLPRFGFMAAAWTTLGTEALIALLAVPLSLGRAGIPFPIGTVPRLLLPSVVMGAAVWGLREAGVPVVVLLIAAVPIYAGAILALRTVDVRELRGLLRKGEQ